MDSGRGEYIIMSGNARIKVDVYSLLKERIQFLEMKPGSRVVEAELSKELGVSRTPIREALKRLEEERFIDIYPQRGTYVSLIDMKTVKEMAYMRHVLENEIFLQLCRQKVSVKRQVEDKLLMMELALRNQDYKAYIQQDARFHRSLFECGGHELIWDAISGFMAHYTRVLVLDMMMPDSIRKSYLSHLKIAECIENGNLSELKKVMEVHHDHYMTENDEKIMKEHPDYFSE